MELWIAVQRLAFILSISSSDCCADYCVTMELWIALQRLAFILSISSSVSEGIFHSLEYFRFLAPQCSPENEAS
ncbi:hypothetical protein BRADI_2g21186v3 [Brachypodium distachyon]|uniref:Uncharacterized protein n=1 Tax=Brachypodium distachyon TaxID=15368 RepID=A0A0Q3K4B0_BRADI|nr:hypothetical protein BRADI_2g21186v3 [Brachypodium distachyon]KQK05616.1 hypothetical protein BRADI_2g21186v3 [Brachypodium distachyon]